MVPKQTVCQAKDCAALANTRYAPTLFDQNEVTKHLSHLEECVRNMRLKALALQIEQLAPRKLLGTFQRSAINGQCFVTLAVYRIAGCSHCLNPCRIALG